MSELRHALDQLAAELNDAAASAGPTLGEPTSFEVDERDGWLLLRIHSDNGGGPETGHPVESAAAVRQQDDGRIAIRVIDHGLDTSGWTLAEALAHLRELGSQAIPSPLLG